MNVGLIAGVLTNMYLWLFTSDWLFWFWWNVTGALTTFILAWITSLLNNEKSTEEDHSITLEPLGKEGLILIIYFVLIVCTSVYIDILF